MRGTPSTPKSEEELDELLSAPRDETVAALERVQGDWIVLGAGGKMGPSLSRMIARVCQANGESGRVTAVSRFGSAGVEASLRAAGVNTISCDLLDARAVAALPDAANVIFMAGQKFGTSDAPSRTWMMNVVVPAICAERYAGARTVVFSTGNVYPLVSVASGGAKETDPTAPIGEYAQSCVGRERVFEHFSESRGTQVAIVRLNYAIALRYGVLTDLALKVARHQAVSLAMGHVNVIWQGDANCAALELLAHTSAPPRVVNVTGTATLSVRDICNALGKRLGHDPVFEGVEAPDALISNTSVMQSLLGAPQTSLDTMLDWVADWVRNERPLLGKATKFEARDGKF